MDDVLIELDDLGRREFFGFVIVISVLFKKIFCMFKVLFFLWIDEYGVIVGVFLFFEIKGEFLM